MTLFGNNIMKVCLYSFHKVGDCFFDCRLAIHEFVDYMYNINNMS